MIKYYVYIYNINRVYQPVHFHRLIPLFPLFFSLLIYQCLQAFQASSVSLGLQAGVSYFKETFYQNETYMKHCNCSSYLRYLDSMSEIMVAAGSMFLRCTEPRKIFFFFFLSGRRIVKKVQYLFHILSITYHTQKGPDLFSAHLSRRLTR